MTAADDVMAEALDRWLQHSVDALDRTEAQATQKNEAEARRLADVRERINEDLHMTEAELRRQEAQELRRKLDVMNAQMRDLTRPQKGGDPEEMEAIRTRADTAYCMHGERAPVPSMGETPLMFRRRTLDGLKKHSAKFCDTRLDGADHAMLNVIEPTIFADAVEAAGKKAQTGMLVAERYRDEAGRLCTKWHGDPMAWMQYFSSGAARGFIDRSSFTKRETA